MTATQDSAAPGSLRLVLTLAIAGLISGIAIIGIYESTLPTITANKARELREAVFKVLPGV
ncbi:MAG: FMN-binding protein, partial [Woeseiaceae bacterium]